MKSATAIGILSVVGAAFLIRSSITVGFTVFVAPIVVAEIIFLGAVYAIWRGLGGGEPDLEATEAAPWAARPRPTSATNRRPAPRPAAQPGLGGRSLVGRTGG